MVARDFSALHTNVLVFRLIFIIVSLVLSNIEAQFPSACLTSKALSKRECCPIPRRFHKQCGGPERGECVDISPPTEQRAGFAGDFDRFQWPTVFFSRVCRCRGNFLGPDCSTCTYGYTGENCDEKKSLVRRNILTLSDRDIKKLKTYLRKAKETTSDYKIATSLYVDMEEGKSPLFNNINEYDLYTWIHYNSHRQNIVRSQHQARGTPNVDFAHGGPSFVTWHRLYLLAFERMLQQVNNDDEFTLPYWDWSKETECNVCNDKYFGGNQEAVPHYVTGDFEGWKALCMDYQRFHDVGVICSNIDIDDTPVITRNPGLGFYDELPTREAVMYCLSIDSFDRAPVVHTPLLNQWLTSTCSFRNILEGFADSKGQTGQPLLTDLQMYNLVRSFFNGTLSTIQSSPSDPLFYAIHSYIDMVFEKWMRRHNATIDDYPIDKTPNGHGRNDAIVPFIPLWTNGELYKRSEFFGYTYDNINLSGRPLDNEERKEEDKAVDGMEGCKISPSQNELKVFSEDPDIMKQEVEAVLNMQPWKISQLQTPNQVDTPTQEFDNKKAIPNDNKHLAGIIIGSVVGILMLIGISILAVKGRHEYYRTKGYQKLKEEFVDSFQKPASRQRPYGAKLAALSRMDFLKNVVVFLGESALF
ncbi:tyrosinase-like [Glandiceps talaboti]